jgi:uncharacterized protein (TIGR00645 family)
MSPPRGPIKSAPVPSGRPIGSSPGLHAVRMFDREKLMDAIGMVIFSSRWGLVVMYLGLYVGIIAFTYKFIQEVIHLIMHLNTINETNTLLVVIDLIDMALVANLINMTMIGSMSIFVRKYDYRRLPDQPQWMAHFNTTIQKAKMGQSLLSICAVDLLRHYMQVESVPWDMLLKKVAIIGVFIGIAVSYGLVSRSVPADGPTHEPHPEPAKE